MAYCAQPGQACYNWDEPVDMGCYISCATAPLFDILQKILVAVVIILAILMIRKTIMGRENQQTLKELPKNWMYIIILTLVAMGAAGTAIDMLLRLLGVGDFKHWLTIVNDFLSRL